MIIAACDALLENLPRYLEYFPLDVFQGGAGTSINMNVNEVIANMGLRMHGHELGDYEALHPNDHVNKCQSTNDAYPTGFRVAIYFYINLPILQAGSSIMPAKVNPVIPEVVNQVCFKIMGNDVTISFAAEAGQLQLNVMEPVIAQCLFESVELLSNACTTLSGKCLSGITANPEHTHQMVLYSVGLITFLNPYIGHQMGDVIGQEAIATGKSIRELILEKELLSEAELDTILSKDNLMHPDYKARLQK